VGVFKIEHIEIPGIRYIDENRIGVVKVQMPEQCTSTPPFRIREQERKRNTEMVTAVLQECASGDFLCSRPQFVLFPELSVGLDAFAAVRRVMSSKEAPNNTVVVMGLETLSKEEFLALVADSDSRDAFNSEDLAGNTRYVNTAVIFVRDESGNTNLYFQPKLTTSIFESVDQFKAKKSYLLKLGRYRALTVICSDFILRESGRSVMSDLLRSIDECYEHPGDEKIHLVLLLQKNKHPTAEAYRRIVRMLHFRECHTIDTSHTVVCAVNSVNPESLDLFRNCNVVVMNRGRPPRDLRARTAPDTTFAWKEFKPEAGDEPSLNYVLWRLREPGMISFILNMDDRPHQVLSAEHRPIEQPGLATFRGGVVLEGLNVLPEIYEFEELLLRGYSEWAKSLFSKESLKSYFTDIDMYMQRISELFTERPTGVIDNLLLIHSEGESCVNCDHWEDEQDLFHSFLLSLAVLWSAFSDVTIEGGELVTEDARIVVMDCNGTPDLKVRLHLNPPSGEVDFILLQRMVDLHAWDGCPRAYDDLISEISQTKPMRGEDFRVRITKARFPRMLTLNYLLNALRTSAEFKSTKEIGESLNACFHTE